MYNQNHTLGDPRGYVSRYKTHVLDRIHTRQNSPARMRSKFVVGCFSDLCCCEGLAAGVAGAAHTQRSVAMLCGEIKQSELKQK